MRNMKKIAALLLTAAMAVSMTGCGGGGTKATEAAGTEAPKTETQGDKTTDAVTEAAEAAGVKEGGKLLFFAIQNIGDYGINDLGYFASQDIAEKYGLDLTLVEGSNDASVRTTSLLDALETGDYDYCITASWYILDDLLAQANEFDTKFIIYDTNPTLDLSDYPGCYGISFRQDEGSFLTAVYQCLMSKTGQIGAVASQDAPILNDFLTGWLAGVKYFNDNMGGNTKYSVAYLSDSTVQGDYETASVLYGANCDIVYNIAGTYCLGAAKACAEAGGTENGRYLVGVDYDQYSVFSQSSNTDVEGYENLVTSMEKKIRESIVSAFDQMAGENCEMSNHRFSLADGGVGLAYNENYHKLTPEDVQKQLTEVENKIKSGEIKVPSYFDFDDYDQFKEFRDNPDARIN
ncbi:MAG: BMP family ABC transporter substrate-binding protein [Hungatella hathewayi]|nr:BMP family ABC transporter substrate-binding protein [Hungatella hathewayi]